MKPSMTILGFCSMAMLLTGGCAGRRIDVQQHGLMHDVLSRGSAEARPQIALNDVLKRPGALAVGALPGLEGEITIVDGRAWVARPEKMGLHIEGPLSTSTEKAALLTVAYVDGWREIRTDQALAGDALEQYVREQARRQGLDPSQPFPFVIKGEATDLQLHVIHGACPMKPGAPLTAEQQPWRYAAGRPTPVTIVGFYARDSVGKLTHPGTSIHAHALLRVDNQMVTGHMERLAVASGSTLKLPVVR